MFLDGIAAGWRAFARRTRRRWGAAGGAVPTSDDNREWIIDEEEQTAAEIGERRSSDKQELKDDVYVVPTAMEAGQRSRPL